MLTVSTITNRQTFRNPDKNAIYIQFLFLWLFYTQQKRDKEKLPLCFSEE